MSRSIRYLFLLLTAAMPLAAAERSVLDNFRYVRPAVRHGAAGDATWYVIPFDSVLYRAVEDFSADLRLAREDRRPVPFRVEPRTANATGYKEEVLSGRFTAPRTLPDGRRAVEFELDSPEAVAALEITLPGKDFQSVLSVAVGDDAKWETALPEFVFRAVPDRSQETRRLNFPKPVTGRRVRLIFGAARSGTTEKPLLIEGLKVIRKVPYQIPDGPELRAAQLTEFSRTETAEHTILIVHSDRAPLRRFLFSANRDFFQRRVTVAGSDNLKTWQPITSGTIRKLDFDEALTLNIPESRYSYYRLVIRDNNRSTPPVELKVAALSTDMRIVFTADHATENLLLYYGGKAPEPHWAGAQFPETSAEGAPGLYELGQQRDNSSRPGRNFATGSKHWIFSILLLAAAGGLLAVLVRTLGGIDRELPED